MRRRKIDQRNLRINQKLKKRELYELLRERTLFTTLRGQGQDMKFRLLYGKHIKV